MQSYLRIIFRYKDNVARELLSYRLGEAGAESLEEKDDELIAYFLADEWHKVASDFIKHEPRIEEVENKNWNALWEASFQPVMIDNFCYVRAPFHDRHEDPTVIDIILEPKMAFGTAHHETTYMMMSEMQRINFSGQQVFDFGCGTAILSVLAEKLGAEGIFAIDIEEIAVENAKYNAEINLCQCIRAEHKLLHKIEMCQYDTILANINRKVLLDSADSLLEYLKPGGVLLMSGILDSDVDLVKGAYNTAGWELISSRQKGEWMCLKLKPSRSD